LPGENVDVCRDKKDNYLLEVALEGEADYLITGDEDILVLGSFHNTKNSKTQRFRSNA
jgi:uncharacterized protein